MFTFFQIIDLSHSFSQIIYIFAVVNQLNSLLILITDTNFKFKKTKMKMQSIMRIAMALVIAFGVETTASAQFGGLKGLAKKAKKAVEKVEKTVKDVNDTKDKVSNQAETTVSETTGVTAGNEDNSSSSNSGSAANYEFKKARQCDWTIDGDINNIIANAEFYASKMQNSMSKGYKGLDYKSYCDLMLGKTPLPFVLDARIDQGGYVYDAKQTKKNVDGLVWDFKQEAWKGMPGKASFDVSQTLQQTQFIIDRGLTFSDPQARSAFFDMAYNYMQIVMDKVTGSESEWGGVQKGLNELMGSMPADYKARYPFTSVSLDNIKANRTGSFQMKRKMGQLIYYKQYEKEGKYGTMPGSKNASFEKQVKEEIEVHKPYWGKVLSTSVSAVTGYRKNKLGVITHRHRTVYVLCEDQGYKALYECAMSEEALGKDKWGGFRLTGAAYEQDIPTKLVK